MAATGRDIVMFFIGLALAGMAPILFMPSLELMPLLGVLNTMAGGVPLHHAGIVAFIALMFAAWVDTDGAKQPTTDVEQWE